MVFGKVVPQQVVQKSERGDLLQELGIVLHYPLGSDLVRLFVHQHGPNDSRNGIYGVRLEGLFGGIGKVMQAQIVHLQQSVRCESSSSCCCYCFLGGTTTSAGTGTDQFRDGPEAFQQDGGFPPVASVVLLEKGTSGHCGNGLVVSASVVVVEKVLDVEDGDWKRRQNCVFGGICGGVGGVASTAVALFKAKGRLLCYLAFVLHRSKSSILNQQHSQMELAWRTAPLVTALRYP